MSPRGRVWRSTLALFKPYGREQLAVAACVLAGSALLLIPAFVTQNLFDRAFPARDRTLIGADVAILLAATAGAAVLQWLQAQTNAKFSLAILRDLRLRLVDAVQRAPMSFLAETKTGELLNRASNDVDRIEQVLSSVLITAAMGLISLVSVSVVLVVLDWRLALLAFALVPAVAAAMRFTSPRYYEAMSRFNDMRDRAGALLHDLLSISGSALVRAYSREDVERTRFAGVSDDLMGAALTVARIGSWSGALMMFVIGAAAPLVILAGGLLVAEGRVTLGTLVAFLSLLPRLFAPVTSLTGLQTQIAGAVSVLERIFEYLDELPQEAAAVAASAPVPVGALGVEFANVRFAYGGARVLDGISFEARPGEVVAIIGQSGSGKTTIANLLMRFVEPDGGTIRIGGADASSIAPRLLRERIGIVTQETHLVHDTVENNVRFARPSATRAEVVAAARAAEVDGFISALPDGYDTVVGESGYKLSGGERQRIAIARALLKDPAILILDEATSALDPVTEAAVQSSLARLMQGRTCIVIAHRPASVRHAHRTYVLAGGRLVETPARYGAERSTTATGSAIPTEARRRTSALR